MVAADTARDLQIIAKENRCKAREQAAITRNRPGQKKTTQTPLAPSRTPSVASPMAIPSAQSSKVTKNTAKRGGKKASRARVSRRELDDTD